MSLAFCVRCRYPAVPGELCPQCNMPCNSNAETYVEKLLEAVLSKETSRAGMAVDVLTKWLHEPRAIVPLFMLLQSQGDPYLLVMAARGLGWLGDSKAVQPLGDLLLNEARPFVARVAAAHALGVLGGTGAGRLLTQALKAQRSSVVDASEQALLIMQTRYQE